MEMMNLIAVLAAVVKLYPEYLVRIDCQKGIEMKDLLVMLVVEELVVDYSVLDLCWMRVGLQEVVVVAAEVLVVVVVVRTRVVDLV
jgi:hypothetical protein